MSVDLEDASNPLEYLIWFVYQKLRK
jgi:hypothetical protein